VPQQIHLGQPSSSPRDNAIIEIYWSAATALRFVKTEFLSQDLWQGIRSDNILILFDP